MASSRHRSRKDRLVGSPTFLLLVALVLSFSVAIAQPPGPQVPSSSNCQQTGLISADQISQILNTTQCQQLTLALDINQPFFAASLSWNVPASRQVLIIGSPVVQQVISYQGGLENFIVVGTGASLTISNVNITASLPGRRFLYAYAGSTVSLSNVGVADWSMEQDCPGLNAVEGNTSVILKNVVFSNCSATAAYSAIRVGVLSSDSIAPHFYMENVELSGNKVSNTWNGAILGAFGRVNIEVHGNILIRENLVQGMIQILEFIGNIDANTPGFVNIIGDATWTFRQNHWGVNPVVSHHVSTVGNVNWSGPQVVNAWTDPNEPVNFWLLTQNNGATIVNISSFYLSTGPSSKPEIDSRMQVLRLSARDYQYRSILNFNNGFIVDSWNGGGLYIQGSLTISSGKTIELRNSKSGFYLSNEVPPALTVVAQDDIIFDHLQSSTIDGCIRLSGGVNASFTSINGKIAFTNNKGYYGAAINTRSDGRYAYLRLQTSHLIFNNNTAETGGVISFQSDTQQSQENTWIDFPSQGLIEFVNNSATRSGGVLTTKNPAVIHQLFSLNTIFTGNSAPMGCIVWPTGDAGWPRYGDVPERPKLTLPNQMNAVFSNNRLSSWNLGRSNAWTDLAYRHPAADYQCQYDAPSQALCPPHINAGNSSKWFLTPGCVWEYYGDLVVPSDTTINVPTFVAGGLLVGNTGNLNIGVFNQTVVPFFVLNDTQGLASLTVMVSSSDLKLLQQTHGNETSAINVFETDGQLKTSSGDPLSVLGLYNKLTDSSAQYSVTWLARSSPAPYTMAVGFFWSLPSSDPKIPMFIAIVIGILLAATAISTLVAMKLKKLGCFRQANTSVGLDGLGDRTPLINGSV